MTKLTEAGYLESPTDHIFFDDLDADINYVITINYITASFGALATTTGHAALHYWIYWMLELSGFPKGYKPIVEAFDSELKEYKETADINRDLFDALSKIKNSDDYPDLDEDCNKFLEDYKTCYGFNYDMFVLIHRGYLCRKEGKDPNDPEVQKEMGVRFREEFSFLEL
ncbi:hypothetical protein FQN50_006046 [Emmonsiellopsis sp. PD_5]|nr:hypothetical protein FQN50_006046 [Emmonsiellopsis sp. PD_5]